MHPYEFYRDFRRAFTQYITDLRKGKPGDGLTENFESAFDWFFIKRK